MLAIHAPWFATKYGTEQLKTTMPAANIANWSGDAPSRCWRRDQG